MSSPKASSSNSEGAGSSPLSPRVGAGVVVAEGFTIHNPPGRNDAIPEAAAKALTTALPRYSQNGGELKRVVPANVSPTPPSDVLVLLSEGNGCWVPVPTVSTAPNAEWTPLGTSPSNPSMVSFVSLASSIVLMKQSQQNLNKVQAENARARKYEQLNADLVAKKSEYAAAKQSGDMKAVGTLSVARDAIEDEITAMRLYDLDRVVKQPEWTESVVVYRSIELPFGYSKFGEGDSVRLYNLVKLQQTDASKLAAKQIVTIDGVPQ